MKTVLIALLVLIPLFAQVDAYRGARRGLRHPQQEAVHRPPQYSRAGADSMRAYNPNVVRGAAGAAAANAAAASQQPTQVIVIPPPQQQTTPAPHH